MIIDNIIINDAASCRANLPAAAGKHRNHTIMSAHQRRMNIDIQ